MLATHWYCSRFKSSGLFFLDFQKRKDGISCGNRRREPGRSQFKIEL